MIVSYISVKVIITVWRCWRQSLILSMHLAVTVARYSATIRWVLYASAHQTCFCILGIQAWLKWYSAFTTSDRPMVCSWVSCHCPDGPLFWNPNCLKNVPLDQKSIFSDSPLSWKQTPRSLSGSGWLWSWPSNQPSNPSFWREICASNL